MQKRILLLILLITGIKCTAQQFSEFDHLIKNARAEYESKNYELSAKYQEMAIHLAENNKLYINWNVYYDMACDYSLSKQKEKPSSIWKKALLSWMQKQERPPLSYYTSQKMMRI